MTGKLALYNKAATNLVQERLAGLTEDVLLKRELDAVYDGVLIKCLEEGIWIFARRTIELVYDPSIDASEFGGLQYGFTLPEDIVRFANISTNPNFSPGSEPDYDLGGPGKLLYSNRESIYLRYVSNGITYGLNLGAWPETFADAVGYRLSEAVAIAVTKSTNVRDDMRGLGDVEMAKAKVRHAVDDRMKEKPVGRLVRSRGGYGRVRSRGPLWG